MSESRKINTTYYIIRAKGTEQYVREAAITTAVAEEAKKFPSVEAVAKYVAEHYNETSAKTLEAVQVFKRLVYAANGTDIEEQVLAEREEVQKQKFKSPYNPKTKWKKGGRIWGKSKIF